MLCWYLTGVESILSFRFKEFSIRNCRGRWVVALHAKANFCATVPLKEFGSQLRSKQWQGYESCDWEAPAVVMPLGTGVGDRPQRLSHTNDVAVEVRATLFGCECRDPSRGCRTLHPC